MPIIINVSSAEQARVRAAIARVLARLNEITDEDLRDCIRKRAQGNDEVINNGTGRDEIGARYGYTNSRSIGPLVVWKSKDIHIFLTTLKDLPAKELENTLMHEWAHTCCWGENDGKGVPG